METIKIFNTLTNEMIDVSGEVLAQDERLFIINTEENNGLKPLGVKYIIFDIKTGGILCCADTMSEMIKTYKRTKIYYEDFIKTNLYKRMCERRNENVWRRTI